MRTLLILGTCLSLTACDAWPTVIDNRTQGPISLQYLHQDYDHWSAAFPINKGLAMSLARAHWVQEIRGIRIRDGEREYSWSAAGIGHLASACPSNQLARNMSFAGNCYLIYLGNGQMKAMSEPPTELNYQQLDNGS